jgi:hypothetical protein
MRQRPGRQSSIATAGDYTPRRRLGGANGGSGDQGSEPSPVFLANYSDSSMASAVTARKRLQIVHFRASRDERERWAGLADAAEVTVSEWIRTVLHREARRLERERLVKHGAGFYGCVCEPGPANGEFCPVCGERRYWTQVRRWKARERMRRLRAERGGRA